MPLKERIRQIFEQSFCLKPEEALLVVTDDQCLSVGELLKNTAEELGYHPNFIHMESLALDGAEPSPEVASAMCDADVAICATGKSLTHTNARINATKTGTRVITMPGITLDMMENGATGADYRQVEKLTNVLTEKLSHASTATILKNNHRLTLDISGRKGIASSGVFREPGTSGNFPSGEAFIAPLETGAEGTTVIDGSMVSIGLLDTPLVAHFEKGKLHSLEGEQAKNLKVLFETPENSTIAELGIGTNEAARLTGLILEDEKIYGTVHVAFGTNTSFGGINKANLHYDGVILKPTLYLDDELILENGVFV